MQKNKNKNAILTKEKENLKSKISLLDEIKKETKITFSKIMDFINRFQEVGEVPRKNLAKSASNLMKLLVFFVRIINFPVRKIIK